MKRYIGLAILCALLLTGADCHKHVVRDAEVYKVEVEFFGQMSIQQADLLDAFIKTDCKCVNGDFPNQQCLKSAILVLLVKRRIQWHKDMMLYNGGLLPDRPSKEPPDTPKPQELCP